MEFMIKTINGDWFQFPSSSGPEVFLPQGLTATVETTSDSVNVKYNECIFSFSVEEPGIQVVLESGTMSISQATVFVEAVVKTVESAAQQECEYIQYA